MHHSVEEHRHTTGDKLLFHSNWTTFNHPLLILTNTNYTTQYAGYVAVSLIEENKASHYVINGKIGGDSDYQIGNKLNLPDTCVVDINMISMHVHDKRTPPHTHHAHDTSAVEKLKFR